MRSRTAIWGFLCLLCLGCANQVTPAGGKKDITPPKLVNAIPAMSAIHFNSKVITLRFNEFLQTIDASKVYITPELSKNIKIVQAHKNVIIKLTPPYRDSTTYTIHFNDVIADNNEGNKLKDFEYVFSTGPIIDSIKLTGQVKDAFTNQPTKDVLVLLYDKKTDSIPYKEKPVYYARSNEKGIYSISHIKSGTYKVFALVDNDGDLKYSQPAEKIGFIDSVIRITSNINNADMRLFVNKASRQKVIRTGCPTPGAVFIKWILPQNQNLAITCKESDLYFSPPVNTDSLMIYVANTKTDSVKLYIQNGDYKDTVLIMMKVPSSTGRNKMSLSVTNNLICDKGGCTYNDTFILKANHPLLSIDTSRILFYADTGKTTQKFVPENITQLLLAKVCFTIKIKARTNQYSCIIKKGAFKDIYGLSNTDSVRLKFAKLQADQKGNLQLTLKGLHQNYNYVLFLIKDNTRIYPTKITSPADGKIVYLFKGLLAGSYSTYVIEDLNNNGYWDTGDYLKHTQPERVYTYPTGITIRSNWDNDIIWEVK